jgi:uncharacterized membrane protein YebE (DUF533 family)
MRHELQHQWSQVPNTKTAQVQQRMRRPLALGAIVSVFLAAKAAAAATTAAATAATVTATSRTSKLGAIGSHMRHEAVMRK